MMRLFSTHKTNRLQYQFLPAAEEIIETPASPFGRIIIWLIIVLLAAVLLWSYFGKLDIIAPATGKVIPEGSIKTLQSATPGVVTEIKVGEGQKVKQGQLLVQLDTTAAQSDVRVTTQALIIAKLEQEILTKTTAGEDVSDSINKAAIPDTVKQHLVALAQSHASTNGAQRQLLATNVNDASKQVAERTRQKQVVADALQKMRGREQELKQTLETANALIEPGVRSELRAAQQQVASLEMSLLSYDQQITQAQAGVREAKEKLAAYTAENSATAYTSIIDADKRINDLENALAKATQIVDQLSIKAPVDGTILSLAVKTVGGVVNTAQPIIEIVPENTPLIVEATVQNKDVGFMKAGQPVVIKVDTYSFQRYGYLKGIVKSISPDAINDEKQGLVYKMKVALDNSRTSKDTTIKVEPGMSVITEITTGQRRIIEFFLDPLIAHTDTSLEVR